MLYIFEGSICSMLFLAKPISGQLTTSSESTELGYYDIEQAKEMIVWDSFKK